jgi:DHA3 family macrolide efflux protein-like MFS transporter
MQKRVPEHMLGRVTSLFVTVTTLASPLGLLIAGVAAEGLGLTRWFVLTGVLLCLLQLVAWLSRSIRSLDDPRP